MAYYDDCETYGSADVVLAIATAAKEVSDDQGDLSVYGDEHDVPAVRSIYREHDGSLTVTMADGARFQVLAKMIRGPQA